MQSLYPFQLFCKTWPDMWFFNHGYQIFAVYSKTLICQVLQYTLNRLFWWVFWAHQINTFWWTISFSLTCSWFPWWHLMIRPAVSVTASRRRTSMEELSFLTANVQWSTHFVATLLTLRPSVRSITSMAWWFNYVRGMLSSLHLHKINAQQIVILNITFHHHVYQLTSYQINLQRQVHPHLLLTFWEKVKVIELSLWLGRWHSHSKPPCAMESHDCAGQILFLSHYNQLIILFWFLLSTNLVRTFCG